MITEREIIDDLKNLISKIKILSNIYKNNDIWRQLNDELNYILIKLEKDKRLYGY